MNKRVKMLECRYLGPGENKVFKPAFISYPREDPLKIVKTDGRQLPFKTREHADSAIVVTTEPNRNNDISTQINPGIFHVSTLADRGLWHISAPEFKSQPFSLSLTP